MIIAAAVATIAAANLKINREAHIARKSAGKDFRFFGMKAARLESCGGAL